MRVNPMRQQIVRVVKGTTLIPSYGACTLGVNGLQVQMGTAAVNMAKNFTFDPSGNFGNFSGTVTSAAQTYGAHVTSEWFSYAAVYKFYKITKVTINFRLDDLGLADTCSPTLYLRYHDGKPTTVVPSPAGIASERNWLAKKFDAQSSTFKYSFIPLVQNLVAAGTTINNLGREARRMQWTSTDTPVEIYGMKMYMNWPANSAADLNSYLNMDVVYHISYKEQA